MVEIVCIMLDEILNTQVTSCFYIIVLFLPSWKSFIVEKHSHWTHSTSCLAEVGCCWKHGIRPDRKKTSKLFRPIWWLFDQIFQDWEVGGDCWLRHVFEAWVEVKQCVLWARFPRQNQCSNRSSKRGARKHPTGYIYCGGDGVRINEPSKNMANMIQSGFTVTPAGHENTSIYTSISNILSDPSSLAYHLIVHPLMTSLFFCGCWPNKTSPTHFAHWKNTGASATELRPSWWPKMPWKPTTPQPRVRTSWPRSRIPAMPSNRTSDLLQSGRTNVVFFWDGMEI